MIQGHHGRIATSLMLPDSFDCKSGRCPLAVLMHGVMSDKDSYPIPDIAQALAKRGIASLRFDFDAHGQSEGEFIDMTINSEIADARAAIRYARSLPFVTDIAYVGHSQGGVVAGMLAGEMENQPERPVCLVQLAPAAVMKDDAIAGRFWSYKFDPANPPESLQIFTHKVGRQYLLDAQTVPIYETTAQYSGKVCIIHGEKDKIVPISYSKRYQQIYKSCDLHIIPNEEHMLNGDRGLVIDTAVSFLTENIWS